MVQDPCSSSRTTSGSVDACPDAQPSSGGTCTGEGPQEARGGLAGGRMEAIRTELVALAGGYTCSKTVSSAGTVAVVVRPLQ